MTTTLLDAIHAGDYDWRDRAACAGLNRKQTYVCSIKSAGQKAPATASTAPGCGRLTGVDMSDAIPVGLCQCGCGETAPIAKKTQTSAGRIKGEPVRFIPGHHVRVQVRPSTPAETRFWRHVDKTTTCWLWTAGLNHAGYGSFQIGRRQIDPKTVLAHRYAYELLRGPIPEGLTLDHVCRVRNCVRPDHLEPVTSGVNTLRGIGPAAINKRKTHCPQGHPYDEANTQWRLSIGKRERIYRCCGQCERDRWNRRKDAERERHRAAYAKRKSGTGAIDR